MTTYTTGVANGLQNEPLVRTFLDFADTIVISLKANKNALVGDLQTDAANVLRDVEAQRDATVIELNAKPFDKLDMLSRRNEIELVITLGKAKIKNIVNKQPLIANVISKYTSSVLKPIKSSVFGGSSKFSSGGGGYKRKGRKGKRRAHKKRW